MHCFASENVEFQFPFGCIFADPSIYVTSICYIYMAIQSLRGPACPRMIISFGSARIFVFDLFPITLLQIGPFSSFWPSIEFCDHSSYNELGPFLIVITCWSIRRRCISKWPIWPGTSQRQQHPSWWGSGNLHATCL